MLTGSTLGRTSMKQTELTLSGDRRWRHLRRRAVHLAVNVVRVVLLVGVVGAHALVVHAVVVVHVVVDG